MNVLLLESLSFALVLAASESQQSRELCDPLSTIKLFPG